jgi:hypothetical protein
MSNSSNKNSGSKNSGSKNSSSQRKRKNSNSAMLPTNSTNSLHNYFKKIDTSNPQPIKKQKLGHTGSTAGPATGQKTGQDSAQKTGQASVQQPPPVSQGTTLVTRTAVVSMDPVEDLVDKENIKRREAYLAQQQLALKGQLQGGVVDDLLVNLPKCGSCRARSVAWLQTTYGSQATNESEPFYTPKHSFWYLGGNLSHFKLRLRVPAYVATLADKTQQPAYLIQVIGKRKYKNVTLRRLRWLSTVAYCWLLIRGKAPVEVQSAFDGTYYYFTENDPGLAAELKKFDWQQQKESITPDALKKSLLAAKQQRSDEAKRKKDKAAKDKAAKGKAAKSSGPKPLDEADLRLIARLRRHKAKLEADTSFSDVKKVIVPPSDQHQHAETKLIQYFLSNFRYGKPVPPFVVVAGVRRPCFVCFARLQVAAEQFAKYGCKLIHKPRPGPYWPSEDALANIGSNEMRRLMENLLSGWHIYVNGKAGYFGKDRFSREKKATWDDLDTDSEDGGSDDEDDIGAWSRGTDAEDDLDPVQAETNIRMNTFLEALARVRQVARGSDSTSDLLDGLSGNAFVDDEDPSGNADNGATVPQATIDMDVAASLYVHDPTVGPEYWGIAVLPNDGGGDCLFHALTGKDLDGEETLAVRQQVAGARNFAQPDSATIALMIAQTLIESGYREEAQGLDQVGDDIYRLMQAVPGIYAGDDEINQWCALRDEHVFVASNDGTIREFGPDTRRDLAGDATILRAQLHRLIQAGEIVLWKTDVHFERVTGIAGPKDQVEASDDESDMIVISDDENG